MRSSVRKRRLGATLETLLLISLVAAVSLGVVVITRTRQPYSAPGSAPNAALLQETATVSDTAVVPLPNPSPLQAAPSVPGPDDPLLISVCEYEETDIDFFVRLTPVIVRATVQQVLPAQWSTPTGERPANPHAPDSVGTIYRPVIVQVDEYVRGVPLDRTLMIMARGGTVGQDSIDFCGNDEIYEAGQQVVLFLYPPELILGPVPPATPGGPPLWLAWDSYTITADGQATNGQRQIPVQQLRDEITAAIAALPSALPSPSVPTLPSVTP